MAAKPVDAQLFINMVHSQHLLHQDSRHARVLMSGRELCTKPCTGEILQYPQDIVGSNCIQTGSCLLTVTRARSHVHIRHCSTTTTLSCSNTTVLFHHNTFVSFSLLAQM